MLTAQLVTPMNGTVTTIARMNIRKGAPNTAAPIAVKAEVGTRLNVNGLIRGENVRGNADWYLGDYDTFFWSGATGGFQPSVDETSFSTRVRRRPNGTIQPLRERDVRSTFGDITHKELGNGRVQLDKDWMHENIVELQTPDLEDKGFPKIQVHVKARDSFQRVFEIIHQTGLSERIITCGGTFVPRHMGWNSARNLSSHTWGIAIDLNVAWNGYGSLPAATGQRGSLREIVPLFEAEGFAWGGYFEPMSICDGMHFELARLDL